MKIRSFNYASSLKYLFDGHIPDIEMEKYYDYKLRQCSAKMGYPQ